MISTNTLQSNPQTDTVQSRESTEFEKNKKSSWLFSELNLPSSTRELREEAPEPDHISIGFSSPVETINQIRTCGSCHLSSLTSTIDAI